MTKKYPHRKSPAALLLFLIVLFYGEGATFALAYDVGRISGQDRYATSAEVSRTYWPLGADSVVIATGAGFADALTGAPLAAKQNAPILLTASGDLPQVIKDEILRLKARNATVLGGQGAVSLAVEEALEALGLTTVRIEGANRYETSAEIARLVNSPDGAAYIATGLDFPDALSASAIAAVAPQTPILLVQKDFVPTETSQVIGDLQIDSTIVVGGSGVINENVAASLPNSVRVAGNNRFETASAMSMLGWLSGMPMSSLFVVSGMNFPDAVSTGPAAGLLGSPIMLTDPFFLSSETGEFLTALYDTVDEIQIIGGIGAVSSSVQSDLVQLDLDLSK